MLRDWASVHARGTGASLHDRFARVASIMRSLAWPPWLRNRGFLARQGEAWLAHSSFLHGADVFDQLVDLFRLQLAFVAGHGLLALRDDVGQFRIG
jgi:hypothetical protein